MTGADILPERVRMRADDRRAAAIEERDRETSALFVMMLAPHVDDAEATARQV